MGKVKKEGKKKKHVEKTIQDVVIKKKGKKEKKVKDIFDEVLLKTEEEGDEDEDGEKPFKIDMNDLNKTFSKALKDF
jgi:hypothetical protein